MSPARTAPAARGGHGRASARSGARRRRWLAVGAAAVLGAGAAIGISRIDFEKAILEITLPLRHDDVIRQQAAEKALDPALIAAVIYEESKFREGQRSSAGAIGLMQVQPRTALDIAKHSGATTFVVRDLHDPEINIRYGSFYLSELLDRYEGNEVAALAAYHAGPGNADRWDGSDLALDEIGFPETRKYVDDVLGRRSEYRDNYADDLGL
jgi:soluble lytic murein transglycosylase